MGHIRAEVKRDCKLADNTFAYPNSFLKTNLKEALDAYGIEEVMVIGAMSHMCIESPAVALSFDFKTIVHAVRTTQGIEFESITAPASEVDAAAKISLVFVNGALITTDQ